VIGTASLLFVASLLLVPHIPTTFINTGSEKSLTVSIAPPPGTSSASVLATASKAEEILRQKPDVELIQTSVRVRTVRAIRP